MAESTARIEANVQRGCLGLVLAFLLLIGGGFLYNQITGKESTPRNQSSLACDHFRNVLNDADVLSATELREKLKEVEGNANIASPAVQSASRALLAASTGGTSADVQAAAAEMLAACKVAER